MNKRIEIGAIVTAVAIGLLLGVLGTTQGVSAQNTSESNNTQPTAGTPSSGSITIDGSSTVYPITEVIVEEFSKANPEVKATVGVSGTGGGFKRFVTGETDINDSSRPIKEQEITTSAQNNIKWVEIPIGLEGLSITVHPDNNYLPNDCISVAQLSEMWKPNRTITSWNNLNSSNPNQQISLYGAGPDSGTFDYFTERVVGQARSSTTDYNPSEDDNVLIQGVENDKNALAYIPHSYAGQAADRVKILKVSDGGDCISPNSDTVTSGEYPLSRPLFLHVNYDSLQGRPELKSFVEFFLSNAKDAVNKVQYVALPDDYYTKALASLKEGKYTTNDNKTFNGMY
jgi:phosphate transport system substrate-binding protein